MSEMLADRNIRGIKPLGIKYLEMMEYAPII